MEKSRRCKMGAPSAQVAGVAVVIALALTLLANPPVASAQGTEDANCPGPRSASHAAPTNGRFAQTFTAQTTGNLITAQVDVTKFDGNADWIMQISEVDGTGTPTNVALATAVIPDATVPISGSTIITGTFSSPATVVAGQQYALVLARPGSGSGTLQVGGRGFADACLGGNLFFSSTQTDPFSSLSGGGADMVFAVFVEPAPAEIPADTAAPQTVIAQRPKDKTKKKTATFEFTGTDARAVASFQCSLDGAAFTPCTSPHTVKVKRGKHTFKVQAIDQAGNVGSPASDDWKRKKKKQK